jgi:hypothetical protein
LTATCASQRVETIADFHCGFNALFGTTITYKAFYKQVAKPHFAEFARTMTERLISDMTLRGCPETLSHSCIGIKQLPCGNETQGDRRAKVCSA